MTKLLVRHETLTGDELLAAARTALGALAETTSSGTDGLLEISAAGISKASGLASYAEERGVDAGDVIAFGDMRNDLPMFARAGFSIAMGQAPEDVRAAADAITASNDEDGVAHAIDEILLGRRAEA